MVSLIHWHQNLQDGLGVVLLIRLSFKGAILPVATMAPAPSFLATTLIVVDTQLIRNRSCIVSLQVGVSNMSDRGLGDRTNSISCSDNVLYIEIRFINCLTNFARPFHRRGLLEIVLPELLFGTFGHIDGKDGVDDQSCHERVNDWGLPFTLVCRLLHHRIK